MTDVMRYGWKPDIPDPLRDKKYKLLAPNVDESDVPDSVDPFKWGYLADIKNQGNLGSCTGNGVCYVIETVQKRHGNYRGPLSRLFAYRSGRIFDNALLSDDGAQIRNVMKGVAGQGVPLEEMWPYDVDKFADLPSREAYVQALTIEPTEYFRCDTPHEVMHSIADGFPVVFGFTVYTSFQSSWVTKTGEVPIPKHNERVEGGHCVVKVGYDKKKRIWKCANSWGTSWGQHGYFDLPFEFDEMGLTDDHWTVRWGKGI